MNRKLHIAFSSRTGKYVMHNEIIIIIVIIIMSINTQYN
jgi:hypothetical protein